MYKSFFPTEKSLLPFHTKRIPLVIGRQALNAELRAEGFDMFDDYVNYEFDDVEDNEARMKKAVDDNVVLLQSPPSWDEIRSRVNNNFNFIIGEWQNKCINFLASAIR